MLPLGVRFFAIVAATVGMGSAYGIVHDQITVRISLEYFLHTHPPLFPTSSPTVLALGWGLLSTWTAGIPLGFVIASAACNGRRWQPLALGEVLRLEVALLVAMGLAAVVGGMAGHALAADGAIEIPAQYRHLVDVAMHDRFLAVWWAHASSYAAALVGGAVVVLVILRRRASRPAAGLLGRDRRLPSRVTPGGSDPA